MLQKTNKQTKTKQQQNKTTTKQNNNKTKQNKNKQKNKQKKNPVTTVFLIEGSICSFSKDHFL